MVIAVGLGNCLVGWLGVQDVGVVGGVAEVGVRLLLCRGMGNTGAISSCNAPTFAGTATSRRHHDNAARLRTRLPEPNPKPVHRIRRPKCRASHGTHGAARR
jgi:hypothetical protein